MDIPDLILITHNRSEYLKKTLDALFANGDDFRLYCWDNASTDGAADLIASLGDERIVHKHFHKENANQYEPCKWFFEKSSAERIGKVDDDILLPSGWVKALSSSLRCSERIGMVGCWYFAEGTWDEQAASARSRIVDGCRILPVLIVAGHSFLIRRAHALRYAYSHEGEGYGLPIARRRMALDGLLSGYPLPVVLAHNMDNPTSPHCIYSRAELGAESSLTARKLGFEKPSDFAKWSADNAWRYLNVDYAKQLRQARVAEVKTRIQRGLLRVLGIRR